MLDKNFDSVSRCSSRTARTRSSRSSRSSHSSHTSKKSIDTLVEVAALKGKLQYMDKEAKQRTELDRVKTEMKLQIAQAKLEALETARDSADEKGQLAPEVDTNHKVQNFLKSQVVNNKPLLENAAGPYLTGSDVLFEDQTLTKEVKTGHTTKEIEIGQDPVISHLNPDTPHFEPHQQIPSMAAVGDRSIRTQSDIYHNPYGPCQTNAVASPVLSVSRNMAPRNDLYLEQAQVDEERNPEKSLVGLAKCLAEQVSLSRLPPSWWSGQGRCRRLFSTSTRGCL